MQKTVFKELQIQTGKCRLLVELALQIRKRQLISHLCGITVVPW